MKSGLIAALFAVSFTAAQAQDAMTITVEDDFDNVAFAVEGAILGQGLVVDSVSHVGEMLNRTAADVGGGEPVYERADVYNFCSATITREVMEADPNNIMHCPYGIFIYQLAGNEEEVVVGFRFIDSESMDPVNDPLGKILFDATAE